MEVQTNFFAKKELTKNYVQMYLGDFGAVNEYGIMLNSQKQLEQLREKKNMATKTATEVVDVPTGEYTGTIEKNEVRSSTEGYEYHETTVKFEYGGKAVALKFGVPFGISEKTVLGQLLTRFGAGKIEAGKTYDTDEYLTVGKAVKFSVLRKKAEKGKAIGMTFSNIVPDSVEPA